MDHSARLACHNRAVACSNPACYKRKPACCKRTRLTRLTSGPNKRLKTYRRNESVLEEGGLLGSNRRCQQFSHPGGKDPSHATVVGVEESDGAVVGGLRDFPSLSDGAVVG